MSQSLSLLLRTAPSGPSEPVIQKWPPDRAFREDIGFWKVAWLKPRHEKAFAADLRAIAYPHYLPLMERTHRRPDSGKPKKAMVPLFPSYVSFAVVGPLSPLYETGRILRIFPVADQERFVGDLEAVRRLLETHLPIEVHPGLRPGVAVRIVRGPLAGLTGFIERHDDQCRFWVNVEMFNRSVGVRISCDALIPQG